MTPEILHSNVALFQGDCLDIMPMLPDKSVDMILTDIPYGEVNRSSNGLRVLDKTKADILSFNLNSFTTECCRVCKGSIYIFCGTEQVSILRHNLVVAGLSTRLIIWEKTNPSPMNGQHIWLSSIECCVFGKFKTAVYNEHCKSSVLRFPCGRSKQHPTEKPLKLFEYLISVSTNPGQLVLDNCAGSGTTGIAAINTGREAILIEKEPDYCDKIRNRVINHVAPLAEAV